MSPDDVALTVDGRVWRGWTEISVTRSMDRVAGSFELKVTERWPGQQQLTPLTPGLACTVALQNEVVITGWIDDVEPAYSASDHTVAIRGRDVTGDLVDCSAEVRPGEWHDTPLDRIVADLVAPFGITVSVLTDVGTPFRRYRLEEGETVWEAIERACRMRSVLAWSDGQGALILGRAAEARTVDTPLVRGENILTATGLATWRDRFSTITVRGQQPGIDDAWSTRQTAQPNATVTDPVLTRYRPLVIIGEHSVDDQTAEQRAIWERQVRAGRSRRIEAKSQGWTVDGRPWRPNDRLPMVDDWLAIDRELLVSTVTFGLSGYHGSTTTLTLLPPDAYAAAPAEPEAPAEIGGSGQTDNLGWWS